MRRGMPLRQQLVEPQSMSGLTPLSPLMRQGTHSCLQRMVLSAGDLLLLVRGCHCKCCCSLQCFIAELKRNLLL